MAIEMQTKKWTTRFPATWDGFDAFREKSRDPLAESTKKKWRPIVRRAEELRDALFDGRAWGDIDSEDIAFELMTTLYDEVEGHGGGEPSENTLRGRYDACNAYFTFLGKTRRIERNPLDLLARPSSKAKDQPFLTPEEDQKLAELEKDGHSLGIWVLARGQGLREGEICDLDDADVDLQNMRIRVRDGKTDAAARTIPILPASVPHLVRYRRWRDKHVSRTKRPTTKFVRTSSGSISKGYVWKLVKEMAREAGIALVVDEETNEPMRTRDGQKVTRVTPHALRRTFASALVESGVHPLFIYPMFGHSSERVFHESYCKISNAVQFEKALLASGNSPFAFGPSLNLLEEELARSHAQSAFDPDEALARVTALRAAAEELERTIVTSQTRRSRMPRLAA